VESEFGPPPPLPKFSNLLDFILPHQTYRCRGHSLVINFMVRVWVLCSKIFHLNLDQEEVMGVSGREGMCRGQGRRTTNLGVITNSRTYHKLWKKQAKVTCFNCVEWGHYSTDCKATKLYFICQTANHVGKDCPEWLKLLEHVQYLGSVAQGLRFFHVELQE
jgi:hypothetical protein